MKPDETFAASVRSARLAKGWSQTHLAAVARKQGLRFHQQTVQRVEEGSRPVRLGEAVCLAGIFGTDVGAMTGAEFSSSALVGRALADVEVACHSLLAAIEREP